MTDKLDVTWLDQAWKFDDPAATEATFRSHLATLAPGSSAAAELTTQIARSLGLQKRYADADALLDTVTGGPLVLARVNLERGRLRNSSGDPTAAVPFFSEALSKARIAEDDFLTVDSLHMLAISDQQRATEWTREGLEVATASDDPRARRWRGALHNNLGWTLHDGEQFTEALAEFEAALAAHRETGTPMQIHIAHWSIARCLRSLGRFEEALTIQERLEREDPEDSYVTEEIALLRAALTGQAAP